MHDDRTFHACRKVDPPTMPAWPPWMVDLWLGYPGQDNGEDGLVHSAARKYARQLQNSLALCSQVSYRTYVRSSIIGSDVHICIGLTSGQPLVVPAGAYGR